MDRETLICAIVGLVLILAGFAALEVVWPGYFGLRMHDEPIVREAQ